NILHSIFVYLKGEGFNKLYLSVKKKDNIFIDLLQDKGFKGFRNLKSVKRFGKSTYKIED
ncbi:MAG TPA: hypothetical protein VFD57_05820, partial [Clostridia bacterium]|nr:hypothetical protein [Clostridia bacterium]